MVGIPSSALKIPLANCFPGKFFIPMRIPNGRLHRADSSVAVPDMCKDLMVIWKIGL